MEELKRYIEKMTRQTVEDLAFQLKTDPADEWTKFLEGKLHAFKMIQSQMEEISQKKGQLH